MKSERQYIELYEACRDTIAAHSAAPLNAVREKACDDLRKNGFPSRKVERYKYTDVDALFAPDYGLNINRLEMPIDPYKAFKCDVPNLSTSLYFIVNDQFRKSLQPKDNLPEGITVDSLRHYAELHPDFVARHYARLASTADDGLTALNTMLAQDGLVVVVRRGVRVERTVQVINILRSDVDLMANRRVLIVMEEGAEARLLFCDHTADSRRFLTTQVTEVFMGRNSSLDICCMEETHNDNTRLSNVYVDMEAGARLCHNAITLHNGTTLGRLNVTLKGEGAECVCNGCVIADKNQHVDNNTLITHAAEHCTSRELYKYVLGDNATGAFAGKVLVRHGAQHTVSEMRNQNICSTKKARMFTQPMLEIYADDVKCSHGSTVGQLNDAAMFYMRQRGISEREARLLLEQAFVNEVIDQIQLPQLRDRLHWLVEKRFRGELSKCEGCKLCR